ncbi:MAG: prepilin-type N-terminal cleavage/methylation domain-containing protein [Phycisphaera sp.]|nr:prepilin-type N-terminal cleavage/methylation domain-containing protein [Phycisphaera sp.]
MTDHTPDNLLHPKPVRRSCAAVTRHPTARRGRCAFTLIELLVSVTITLILFFIINQLLYSSSQAVSMGAATSDMISASRAIGDQVQRDANKMLGPSDSGLLVIVNTQLQSTLASPNNYIPMVTPSGGEAKRKKIRSDHLVFFRDATGMEPMTAYDNTSYSNSVSNPGSAKVWYGHVRRVGPQGFDYTDADWTTGAVTGTGAAIGDLNSDTTGYNQLANQWTLGRQAVLTSTTSTKNVASSFAFNATINTPLLAGHLMWNGTCDVTTYTLSTFVGTLTDANYLTEARKLTYDPSQTNGQRLRASIVPGFNATAGFDNFQSWRIAQTHSVLAPRVSDFIVEFAGKFDAANAGSPLDTVGGSGADKDNTLWYFGIGGAKWSGTAVPAVGGNFPFVGAGGTGPAPIFDTSSGTFVFRHGATNTWPQLLRIRYRLCDRNGNITDGNLLEPADANDPGVGRWFEVIVKVNRQ